MPASAAVSTASAPPDSAAASRRHNEGHGRRLTAAFEALEAFPALAESRNRVLRLFSEDQTSTAEVVAAVESDVALAIAGTTVSPGIFESVALLGRDETLRRIDLALTRA